MGHGKNHEDPGSQRLTWCSDRPFPTHAQPLLLPAPKSGLGPVSPPQPELRTPLFHSERLFKAPLTVFPRGTQTPLSRGSRAPFTSLSPSGLPLRSVTSHPFLLFFKGDMWPQHRLAAHWKVHVVISWC